MAKLPTLTDWKDTREGLRLALEPLRSAKLAGSVEQINALHHSIYARRFGATTGELDFGGELQMDYMTLSIKFAQGNKQIFEVPLKGHSQKSLFEAVSFEFAKLDIKIEPHLDKVESDEKFKIDNNQAMDFAELQWRMNTVLARVKLHFLGPQTPLVLWPHGFDLSTVWFAGDKMNEKEEPQMNFGFSPGYAGIDEPYLYFYAWPVPQGLTKSKLPAGGFWNEVWSTPSAVFKLSHFADMENPEEEIMKVLLNCYWEISPKLIV